MQDSCQVSGPGRCPASKAVWLGRLHTDIGDIWGETVGFRVQGSGYPKYCRQAAWCWGSHNMQALVQAGTSYQLNVRRADSSVSCCTHTAATRLTQQCGHVHHASAQAGRLMKLPGLGKGTTDTERG